MTYEDSRCKRCEREINKIQCGVTGVWYVSPCVCLEDYIEEVYKDGKSEGYNEAKDFYVGKADEVRELYEERLEEILDKVKEMQGEID